MSAQQEDEEEIQETQIQDHNHYLNLLSSYLGLSFAVFLGLLPKNAIARNNALAFRLIQTEEQLEQLRTRRKEDSKANARVAEIFASHRHGWQQEEKRLLQQIQESNQEISYLKTKVQEFQRLEDELKELKREVSERDEMINFMSNCSSGIEDDNGSKDEENWYAELGLRFGDVGIQTTDHYFLPKPTSFQDHVQFQSHESIYMNHFVARRETSWQGDGISVSSKLKLLDHELVNAERFGVSAEEQLRLHKQAKRYQALAAKIDKLCDQMKASDLNEAAEFQAKRQTEFLLEAVRLQQRALEINDKLGEVKPCTKRSLGSVRNNFKEIQRSLEIWLARILGDLEGSLAKDDGASRAMDQYYVSRYP